VLDALDECHPNDQKQLIQRLEDFYHQTDLLTHETWLKFLITSRPYDEIKDSFKAITDFFPHIHLKGEEENDQIHEEINLVIRIRVKELAETALLSSDVQQQLERQLLQMEHRTYLWLHLAIDDICNTFQNSFWPAKEPVRLIPASVDAAYERILGRVPSNQVHTVRKILQIIVGARRPLTTQEMAMALGIALSPRSQTAAEAGINPARLAKRIRQLCGLFVFINNSKLYLIHQTAREFLINRDSASSPNSIYTFEQTDAEKLMSQVCIRYLLMDDVEQSKRQTDTDHHSLLKYSSLHWPYHVRNISLAQQQEIDDLLHHIYDTAKPHFAVWFPVFWECMTRAHISDMSLEAPHMHPIHLAAFNGHTHMVRKLLAGNEINISEGDGTGSNALMWASMSGYKEIVELLLEHKADVNAQCGEYGNALQVASFQGHEKTVQLLLEHRADANVQGGWLGNALQAASTSGHDRIVQMLLERGADVNAQGGWFSNALQAASFQGHEKIVQMLLGHGAEIYAQRGGYDHPLPAASYQGHERIVQMLLEHGADAHVQGGHLGDALREASFKGHERIVQMLLEYGADAHVQGGWLGNALQAASSRGHEKIVQMLQAVNLPAERTTL
jgi:ankyrin repeat protein